MRRKERDACVERKGKRTAKGTPCTSQRTYERHRTVKEVRVRMASYPNFFNCAMTCVRSVGHSRRSWSLLSPRCGSTGRKEGRYEGMEATTGGREGWKVRKEGSDNVRERRVERRWGGDDGKGGKEETEAWRRGRRGMERWQEGVEAMTGGKEEGKGSRYGREGR